MASQRNSKGPRRSTTPGGASAATPRKGARSRKGKKPGRGRRIAKWLGILALLGLLLGGGAAFAVYNAIEIPDPNRDFQAQSSQVYYQGGKAPIGSFAEQERESMDIADIPQHMQDAAVSAEDRTFWTNNGIDVQGIVRAALSNARGNATQGASTITQQYVKILYLTSEQTLTRKIKEAVVSVKLHNQQSKQEIMEGYLNTIYFGRGAYGVQAASRAYFGHDAEELTVAESATLAAILNSPSNSDPATGDDVYQRVLGRYQYVLNGMVEAGTLEASERDRIYDRLPKLPQQREVQRLGGQRGFMLELVRAELNRLGFDDYTIDSGGLKVTTTFNRRAMTQMQAKIRQERPEGRYPGLHIGAASIDVKTGALRAMFGGQDYLRSPYNWALRGGQPGSTFKAFGVAAALEDGFALKDTFDGNSPYEVGGASIRNQGERDYGPVSMTTATQFSINTAFVDMAEGMEGDGPQKILDTADALGIPVDRTDLQPNPGVSLGSERVGVIDMVNAYAAIANRGSAHPWYVVQKVERISDGEVLKPAPKVERDQAIPRDIADDTSYALQQVVNGGTGEAALALGRPAAGKTGTATNDQDQVSSSWFMGYTPQIATGVMYVRGDGNDQLDGWLPEFAGGAYPARTWTAIMGEIMAPYDVEEFPEPAFVDGDAPSEGHEPYTPPPAPEPEPEPEPSESPSPTPTPSREPEPTPTPEPEPTPDPGDPTDPGEILPPPGDGGGGNDNGAPAP